MTSTKLKPKYIMGIDEIAVQVVTNATSRAFQNIDRKQIPTFIDNLHSLNMYHWEFQENVTKRMKARHVEKISKILDLSRNLGPVGYARWSDRKNDLGSQITNDASKEIGLVLHPEQSTISALNKLSAKEIISIAHRGGEGKSSASGVLLEGVSGPLFGRKLSRDVLKRG